MSVELLLVNARNEILKLSTAQLVVWIGKSGVKYPLSGIECEAHIC